MDPNKSKKTDHLNSSSMVDLKAELFRKQEEYNRRRLQEKEKGSYVKGKISGNDHRKPDVWNRKNKGVTERSEKDAEQKSEEENVQAKTRKALEAKARLYDQMMNNEDIPEEDGSGIYLVDFQKKAIDSMIMKKEKERKVEPPSPSIDDILPPTNPDEEWVDYVDSLGRSRRCFKKDLPDLIRRDEELSGKKSKRNDQDCGPEPLPSLLSSDMYRELRRKKWEEEEEAKLKEPVGPVHYANVLHDEIRTHGVGFYQFSKDEEERQKQMETLNKLRDDTVDARSKSERLKEKRKAQLDARLAKVKQRRKMKDGYVEESENNKEEEIGPKLEEMIAQQRLKVEVEKVETIKKEAPVREWDKGKEKAPSAWNPNRYFEERREERDPMFAPPSIYKDTPVKDNPKTIVKPLIDYVPKSKPIQNQERSNENTIQIEDVSSIPLPGEAIDAISNKEEAVSHILPDFTVPPPNYYPSVNTQPFPVPPSSVDMHPSNTNNPMYHIDNSIEPNVLQTNYHQYQPVVNSTFNNSFMHQSSSSIQPKPSSENISVPRGQIIDTRLVNREDGLDKSDEVDMLHSCTETYKPGSFTLASMKTKQNNADESNSNEANDGLDDGILQDFYSKINEKKSYSGEAVKYVPTKEENL